MHDCLEGCSQYEVKELLKKLIELNVISLNTLNEAITSFPYQGPDARNKPAPIAAKTLSSSDHTLKQNGETYLIASLHFMYRFYEPPKCSFTDVVPWSLASTDDWGKYP